MRRASVKTGLLACALLLAPVVHAQFDNRSLGLTIGGARLTQDNLQWSIPFSLEFSQYLDDGFEATASFQAMYLRLNEGRLGVMGITPAVGFRYLFLQEQIRPWLGADVVYFHVFDDPTFGRLVLWPDLVGFGAKVGCEFFVAETISIGVKANANFFFVINQPVTIQVGASLTTNVYF